MITLYQNIIPFFIRKYIRSIFYLIRYFPLHFSYLINIIFNQQKNNYLYNLAIMAIIKNEGQYLKEWIEYHKIVGVSKFIIYDNESDDNTKDILMPYIENGIVDYTWYPGYIMQRKANNHAIKKWRNKVKYLAIIDADEFIVPVKYNNILEVLNEIETETKKNKKEFVGLIIKWVMFGYNGHYLKPNGLVTENFTKSDGIARLYKCIINPRMVVNFRIHSGNYIFNYFAVDENGNVFINAKEPSNSTINKIRINHYWTKSYEEFKVKHSKGSATRGKRKWNMPEYDPTYFSHNDDKIIEKFIPSLKQGMYSND